MTQLLRSAPQTSVNRTRAASAATDSGWDILLIALAGYLFTAVGRIHQLFGILEPLHLAVLSSAGAAGLYLVNSHRARTLGASLAFPQAKLLLGLLLWAALSVPGALNTGMAFSYFTEFIRTIGMAIVLISAPRSVKDVGRLAGAFFACTAVYSYLIVSRFQLGEGDQWRLGSLYYYDANDFAALAASAIPLGVYLVVRRGSLLTRAAALVGMALLAKGIIWSGSRGGFLALASLTLFLLFRFSSVRAPWRIVAFGALAFLFARGASEKYWTQMQTITTPQNDYNMTDEEGRVEIWKRGVGYMVGQPLLGVGAGNFPVAEGMISPLAARQAYGKGVRWSAAHNSFVQIGAELGVPGLFLFGAIFVTTFVALHAIASPRRVSTTSDDREAQLLAQCLTASLVGFMVGIFFLAMAYHEVMYCLVAIAVGLLKVTAMNRSRAPAIRQAVSSRFRTA